MCEILVGLPEVNVLGIEDGHDVLEIHVECRISRPGCPECGVLAHLKDQGLVTLVDLPCFGRCTRLLWHKHRWRCPDPDCANASWTEEDDRIAAPRLAMTDRAGRWITEQVGRCARSVNEVAKELGCDWHTVNDAVVTYGEALVDHPGRFDMVEALGFDEALMVHRVPWRRAEFSTQIVDVGRGQLLDVVPGRSGTEPSPGWPHGAPSGARGCVSPPWTSRAPIARCQGVPAQAQMIPHGLVKMAPFDVDHPERLRRQPAGNSFDGIGGP